MKDKLKLNIFLFKSKTAGVIPALLSLYLFRHKYPGKKGTEIYSETMAPDPEFTGFRLQKIKSSHSNHLTILPNDIVESLKSSFPLLENRLNSTDVIVASYPKSGTTWLSEIIFLLMNDLNYELAKAENLEWRVPYLEYIWPSTKEVLSRSSPRVLKTHLPFDLLPDDVQLGRSAKVVYILRDPRDVVLSYYNFAKSFIPAGYKDNEGLDGFVDRFVEDRLPYCSWSSNVKSYLFQAVKLDSNVLIMTYEELTSDLSSAIRKLERFLHPQRKPLKDSQLEELAKHCSFEEMKKNPSTNYHWWIEIGLWKDIESTKTTFINQGRVGGYKDKFTDKMCAKIEEKVRSDSMGWTLVENKI